MGKGGGARAVALGILTSRLFGLVREKCVAYFFGVGPHADVWRTAFRAPNVIQNLLGEQTLSAAFIPIYSRLLGEGREEEAGRFAGAIFGLLTAVVAAAVLIGVMLAAPLVAVLAPGYLDDGTAVAAGELAVDRYPLAVTAARIIFPMTGLLVLSAWALGILNSHRRFFLPYFAPVLWNSAIIGGLVLAAGGSGAFGEAFEPSLADQNRWLFAACLGALVGGALQFGVQLPLVLRLSRGLRPSLSLAVPGVRRALAAVGPALAGRGVVQLGFYVDLFLASLLAAGAVAGVGWAAILAGLPLSVFGMAVAAAELPEMAREDPAKARPAIARRVDRGVRQVGFVILPATVGYLAFGLLVVALLFEGGEFGREDAFLVAAVLAGYTIGLPASTISRLLQNTFFALGDTRTPARGAAVRLVTAAILGFATMWWLDRHLVGEVFGLAEAPKGLRLGALGLSLAAGVAGWVELVFLRRALSGPLPELRLPGRHLLKRLALALLAALPAGISWWWVSDWNRQLQAVLVLGLFGGVYLAVAWFSGAPELEQWLGRFGRRR